jgi:DNA gyrase/topoisomerase IV subunit A
MPAASIPAVEVEEGRLSLERAAIPHEPNAGEALACLAPISRIALAECLIQTSRRGYAKKIGAGMVESILANHYIGSGVRLPADIAFDLALCSKEDRLALVSWEGYLLCLEAGGLPFAIEEAMKLGVSDHLTATLVMKPGHSLLAVTQVGKIIHRAAEGLEVGTPKTRGQPLYSQRRREQGIRVVGAAAAKEEDWGAAIHRDGYLTLHALRDLFGSGTLSTESELLAFAAFSTPAA